MTPLSVFVVHPDVAIANRLAAAIAGAGHSATVLSDGERAIDRFVEQPADVVIVDLALPGRDGGATIEGIRWAPGGNHVSVILTATRGVEPGQLEKVAEQVGAIAVFPGTPDEMDIVALLGDLPRLSITVETTVGPAHDTYNEPGAERTTSPGDDHTRERRFPFDEELGTEENPRFASEWPMSDLADAAREGHKVELHASLVAERGKEARVGDLSGALFPRVLAELSLSGVDGGLVLVRNDDPRPTTTGEAPKKIVYFRRGVPVNVESNLVQECLGQMLVRSKVITPSVLDESVRRMRRGEGRQGAILLELGALSEQELRDALTAQLRHKLFDLFAWTSGKYWFSSTLEAPDRVVGLELTLAEALHQGITKNFPEASLLASLAPNMSLYVRLDSRRSHAFRRLELSESARMALHYLDGALTLREVVATAGERTTAAGQLLFALDCAGLLEFSTTSLLNAPTPQGRPLKEPDGELEQELVRLDHLLRAGDLQKAVAAPSSAPEHIAEAADLMVAKLREAAHQAERSVVRAMAAELSAKLVRARSATLRPGPPEPVAPETRPAMPRPALVKTETEGEKDARQADPLAPAHVDPSADREHRATVIAAPISRSKKSELNSPKPEKDAPKGRAKKAPKPKDDRPKKRKTKGGTSARGSSDSEAASEQATRVTGAEDAPPLDAKVQAMIDAEQHFRRGRSLLERNKFAAARDAFAKAVDACPAEAEFVVHLGYARHLSAPDEAEATEQALRELALGCQLAPRLETGHLYHARVLEKTGDAAGARAAYARALDANPESAEARAKLHTL